MKCTLCITLQCNLDCSYCYVSKGTSEMTDETSSKALDFIFRRAIPGDPIEIGLFGGEPLLNLDLLQRMVGRIRAHPAFAANDVRVSVVTNGTLWGPNLAHYLKENDVTLCVSCDGPPEVQDRFRRTRSGGPTSAHVERTLREAIGELPTVLVNAVYRPETFDALPATVSYLASLGAKSIYLNPDFTAPWTEREAKRLPGIYKAVADQYVGFQRAGDPRFISLVEGKIALLVNGGYRPQDRCAMGRGEFAIAPDGSVYPCERLLGGAQHRIGHVDTGVKACRGVAEGGSPANGPCTGCSLSDYCMHWCGCSNYFSTGSYGRVGPFLCASERAAIAVAAEAFETLSREFGPRLLMRLTNQPCA